tara:strand:+ start:60503 stop:61153 length:651 start_codon:yes stop_codon:yes gene_type:complete
MNSIYYETLKKYARVIQFTVISITLTSCSYFHPHNSYAGPKHYDSQRAITAPKDGMISSPSYHDRWNPGWTRRDMWGPGMMGPTQSQRMARHWTFMHSEIPSEYRGQINPIPSNKQNLQKGSELYHQSCAGCHGINGMGDGDLGKDLSPSPALLAYMIQMPMAVDEYMMWSISEGGKQFGTAMPGFKEQLTREEIWKIVSFMRAGFPSNTQVKETQ